MSVNKYPPHLYDEAFSDAELQLKYHAIDYLKGDKKKGEQKSNSKPIPLKKSRALKRSQTSKEKIQNSFNFSNFNEDWLANKYCLKFFMQFLQKEHCEEILLFYIYSIKFFNLSSQKKRDHIAPQIFNRFIATEAPQAINISGKTRTRIEKELKESAQRDGNQSFFFFIIIFFYYFSIFFFFPKFF